MNIDRPRYEEAYGCARKVYAGSMRITEAQDHLEGFGINRNSAADLVYNLGRLLDGRRYTRALSISVADDYLTWIKRDYGEGSLRKAVSALRQHIEYYQSLTGAAMPGQLAVLAKHSALLSETSELYLYPDEELAPQVLYEGRIRTILVDLYERNPTARRLCIEAFGSVCVVCEFDFERVYGAIGRKFIHVHHLRDLASIGEEYAVDPLKDLRPVCPNCHAMLHKSQPAYTIEEMKEILCTNK